MKKLLPIIILIVLSACAKDEIIIKHHDTVLDTIKVDYMSKLRDRATQTVYDTIRSVYYDTVRNYLNDTLWTNQTITKYDTITTYTTQTKYDTVWTYKTVTKYDTVWTYNTTIKYDTIQVKVNDTVWTYKTITKYDTIKVRVNDTVWSYDVKIKYDTIKLTVNDTIWTYKTETKYDTIQVTVYDTITITINPPNYYTIKYIIDPLSGIEKTDIIEKGEKYNIKADVQRDGYRFIFWNTQEDGLGIPYEKGEEINVTEDMVLYGIWAKDEGISVNDLNNYLSTFKRGDTAYVRIKDISPNITKIKEALDNYKNIKVKLYLEDCLGISEIPEASFSNCTNLISITIPNSVTKIADFAFHNTETGRSNLSEVILPNHLEEIGQYAFVHCTKLEHIDLPETISKIGNDAFEDCPFKELTIPANLKEITTSSFASLTSLETLTIQEGVEIIGENAFWNCNNLTSVSIPKSVKMIGTNAFGRCNLKSLILNSTIPPTIPANEKPGIGLYRYYSGPSSIQYIYDGTTIYVPQAVLEKYLNWSGWKELADYIIWY